MAVNSARSLLEDLQGKRLLRARRIFYTVDGEAEQSEGPIELHFDSDVIVLDVASDGEALKVTRSAWQDPFDLAPTADNAEFIATSGKWTAFDVSDDERYAPALNAAISSVRLLQTDSGKLVGCVIGFTSGVAWTVQVRYDELHVDFS